ncbi:uncharacterized protein LOC124931488 [Impatiens glandulifera]|uniref:uncharacterized protein LOC124931488 n=1 Tax=Impatiens glandulifera TaxID=253017 RepID=UPI001FB0E845|nr:uncharacterized protein LOC124931488 [Impatiens glandulifera]
MSGMLHGVESARRRRFHHTGVDFSDLAIGTVGSTSRSSFCLYSSNFASHNSFAPRSTTNQIYQVEELGGVARVAKDRLDERLKAQWKSDAKRIDVRNNNGQYHRGLFMPFQIIFSYHRGFFSCSRK